jgi:hypothetical protein
MKPGPHQPAMTGRVRAGLHGITPIVAALVIGLAIVAVLAAMPGVVIR